MSDDKLQKSETGIEVAGNIGDAIERAVEESHGKLAPMEGKPAVTVWPGMSDVCKCGHKYSEHNYSDSLGSKTDPLGFMYECRGAGWKDAAVPREPQCSCKQFNFLETRASVIVDKSVDPFFTDERTCIGGVSPDNTHECPGMRVDDNSGPAPERTFYCKCSCENCLSATRKLMQPKYSPQSFENLVNTAAITDENTCLTCGMSASHLLCEVSRNIAGIPVVCKCECKECKRAWFSDGRPVVRDGKIVRATPETFNPVKVTEADQERWAQMRDRAAVARRDRTQAAIRKEMLGDETRPSVNAFFQSSVADEAQGEILKMANAAEDMVVKTPVPPKGEKFAAFARKVGSPPTTVLATNNAGEVVEGVDLLEVARGLRRCTHPDHVDGQLCVDRAVACSPDCPCCAGIAGIKEWSMSGETIPLTVEPLNPTLRAERKVEGPLGQMMPAPPNPLTPPPRVDPEVVDEWRNVLGERVEKPRGTTIAPLSESEPGRLWRGSDIPRPDEAPAVVAVNRVPPGEMTARVNEVKLIKDKNGKPQLAIEMTVVQTGEKMRSVMSGGSNEANASFMRDLIQNLVKSGTEVPIPKPGQPLADEDDVKVGREILAEVEKGEAAILPVVIPPPPLPPTCNARGMDGIFDVGCIREPGHGGPHRAKPLLPGGVGVEWIGE